MILIVPTCITVVCEGFFEPILQGAFGGLIMLATTTKPSLLLG